MKHSIHIVSILLLLVLLSSCAAFLGRRPLSPRLSEMPREEREALLLQWAKEEQKGILKRGFKGFQLPTDSVAISEYTNTTSDPKLPPKLYYIVELYNKKAVEALRYEWLYSIKVTFSDETGATCVIVLGSGIGYYPEGKPRYKPKSKGK